MKTAFIIFSTNAIKIHKFSSSLICHTLDSERAASSMLHDFHKAHHPSDKRSHFGERLHNTPPHFLCPCPCCRPPQKGPVQTPDQLQTPEAPRGSRMQPSLPHAALHRPPLHPIVAWGRLQARSSRVLLFSRLASQFHLNHITSASTKDAHKLTMLNVSNLTSCFLVNSVKFLCFITDSYSQRACVK